MAATEVAVTEESRSSSTRQQSHTTEAEMERVEADMAKVKVEVAARAVEGARVEADMAKVVACECNCSIQSNHHRNTWNDMHKEYIDFHIHNRTARAHVSFATHVHGHCQGPP